MRIGIVALACFFCGCAYLTNDVHIEKIVAPGWLEAESVYSYSCKKDLKISVLLNKTLATEGSTYLLFGVAPVGKAEFSGQDLNLAVVYTAIDKVCEPSDVYLAIGNENIGASKVWKGEGAMACVYLWPNKFPESGSLEVNFENIQGCDVPPIEVQYERKTKYNYDSLAG